MIVVKLLVDCRALQSSGNVGTRCNKRRIPQLGDFKNFILRAERFFKPDNDFFFQEIDNADEIIFAAEGKLEGNGMSTEALTHGANDVVKIGAHTVHLVDEC